MKNIFYLTLIILLMPVLVLTACSPSNKYDDGFTFIDATFENGLYKKTVSNNTEEFNFKDQIKVNGGYEYKISIEENAANYFTSFIVPLGIGDNYFYIHVSNSSGGATYKTCIRRRPIYKVSFNSMGGNEIQSQYIEEDGFALTPQNPIKNGYTFVGWDKNITTTVITNDTIFNAIWNVNSYTINFNSNGGSPVDNILEEYLTPINAPANPEKRGYLFNGWYLDNNTFQSPYIFDTMPDHNISLYAKWDLQNYDINYNLNGGQFNSAVPMSYNIESGTIELPIPTKDNCVFIGWYSNEDFNEQIITQIPDNEIGAISLFAKWQYIINNINADKFAEIINDNANKHDDFKLCADINLNGIEWIPINNFKGNFDGDNHTISNFTISINEPQYAGFFGNIEGIRITNLKLEQINFIYSTSSTVYVGGLSGWASKCTIENCVVTGEISVSSKLAVIGTIINNCELYAGGLVGYCKNGMITNCKTNISIDFGIIQDNAYVGGLVGYSLTPLTYCNTIANISGSADESFAGGLVGYSLANISNCYSTGSLSIGSTNGSSAGGLVGKNSAFINACWAQFTIHATNSAGGLVGENSSSVENCYAICDINTSSYNAVVGGLIGSNNSNYSKVINSYSTGKIVSLGHYVGGLIGRAYPYNNSNIKNCFTSTNLEIGGFEVYFGGLIGYGGDEVKDCFISNEQVITLKNATHEQQNNIGTKLNILEIYTLISSIWDNNIWCIENSHLPTFNMVN